jgi:electron transfer flavoprotein alpha subunit
MAVLIYTDCSSGKVTKPGFEAINYGKKIANKLGTEAFALVIGDCGNVSEMGNYGASKVFHVKGSVADAGVIAKIFCQAAEKEGADVLVFSHSLVGRAVAPRVAARLDAGHVAGAIDIPSTDGAFVVAKSVFSGKAFANVEIKSSKKVISLLPNSIQIEEMGGQAEIIEMAVDSAVFETKIKVKEVKKKEGEISLREADLVVSAGRGLKGPENWGMVEEMAKLLGAATACSRPVADIGWRPHHEHVGQTGVAIAPNLYIAIGISGAIQHLAGVNRSKVIVVINKDPEAPFFKAADYGIVGDAFEVVPRLNAALKKFKEGTH